MISANSISSVAYKKSSWMRYTLWGIAATCIAVLLYFFFDMMNYHNSPRVPDGYKFSVTNNYTDDSKIHTTYYVYNDSIFVENESIDDDMVNRMVLIYDNINTESLSLDTNDTIEDCELGFCHQIPKVISSIKKLISGKIGREYVRL